MIQLFYQKIDMENLQDYTVVFDLDDTLYSENDYVISGISFLEEFVYKVYKIRLEGKLLDAYVNGNRDFLDIATFCKLLISSKDPSTDNNFETFVIG